jgi:hypothetical protein
VTYEKAVELVAHRNFLMDRGQNAELLRARSPVASGAAPLNWSPRPISAKRVSGQLPASDNQGSGPFRQYRGALKDNRRHAFASVLSVPVSKVPALRLKIGTYDQAKRLIFVYDLFSLRNWMHA